MGMDVLWPVALLVICIVMVVFARVVSHYGARSLVAEIKAQDPLIVWISQGRQGGVYVNTTLSREQTIAILEGALDVARDGDLAEPSLTPAPGSGAGGER